MTTFRFFTNLRPATVASFERSGYAPDAWLLSSHRLDDETRELAAWARGEGRDLFADNGTHPLIGQVVELHEERLAGLSRDIRALRRSLPGTRRVPHAREVPDALRDRARAAAHAVTDDVDRLHEVASTRRLTERQLGMEPTHLVAREDFAVACILALGLEREITGLPVDWFRRRNRVTLGFWERASELAGEGVDVYATLGAADYNTARAVAVEAAGRGVTHVALGFAGINRDPTFVDRYLAGRWRVLPGSAPRRYIRAAEIACGIRDGYREADVRLRAFHALGMGARDQFPAMAAAFDWYTHISVDATSPLHDSVRDRVFYDHDAWGDRVHLTDAARRVLRGGAWSFDCPFCGYVAERLGHDPSAARAWWADHGEPEITTEHLDPGHPLADAVPLFATARGSATSVQTRARTAHNHWVVDHLCAEVPASRRADWARERMRALEDVRTRGTRLGIMAARAVIDDLDDDPVAPM